MRTIRPAALLILLLALLAGCGNKGDLVKPTPSAAPNETPAGTAPAPTPPDNARH